jgi:transposase
VGATRRKFTVEYKAEAVELVINSGRPIREKPLNIDERARLKELEEEVRRLKMEREILKKAAAWFAKEST